MRKRYSRSYTVLSFLTMFSYREQPFAVSFKEKCYVINKYEKTGKKKKML